MKKVAAIVSALLVVGLVGTASAGSRAQACAAGEETKNTFELKVKSLSDQYRVGEKAQFRVSVHRVVEGHDLGPVEDARVALRVTVGEVYLSNVAMTDAKGQATMRVPLKRYVPTGIADVMASASKVVGAESPCHIDSNYEDGWVEELGLFRVVR